MAHLKLHFVSYSPPGIDRKLCGVSPSRSKGMSLVPTSFYILPVAAGDCIQDLNGDYKLPIWQVFISIFEPPHDKTNKMARAPSKDSDQPRHSPSLIRVFAVRSMGSKGFLHADSENYDQTGRMPRLI